MAINQFNYLDISNLVINELIGDIWLTLIIGILLIIYFGVVNTMDFKSIGSLLIVWAIGLSGYYYNSAVLAFTALIVAFIGYGIWSKFISR